MSNPVAKRDLVDSILELRAEAEQQLKRNKYYLAIVKLDELLEQIRPLEAEAIDEEGGTKRAGPASEAGVGGHRDELGDEPDAEILRKSA